MFNWVTISALIGIIIPPIIEIINHAIKSKILKFIIAMVLCFLAAVVTAGRDGKLISDWSFANAENIWTMFAEIFIIATVIWKDGWKKLFTSN